MAGVSATTDIQPLRPGEVALVLAESVPWLPFIIPLMVAAKRDAAGCRFYRKAATPTCRR